MATKFSPKRIARLVDFGKLYRNATGAKILNDSTFSGRKINEERVSQLFYDIDPELGFVAACECRAHRGNYFAGHVCPYCNTTVSSEFTRDMSHVNWIVLPEHVPPVIHPVFFTILKEWLGKTMTVSTKKRGKVSLIQAILDPSEELPHSVRSHIHKQGFKYFYEHHEEIMDFFLNTYKPTKKKKKENALIKMLYDQYKDILFIRQIPTLHPSLTPIAKEGKMKAIDPAAACIMAAISDASILGFESRRCLTETKYVDKMLWKVYMNFIMYVEMIVTKKYGEKYGHVRRHMMGARIHYSARSVIVPIVEPHRGDEIHIPWKIALGALKNEILNVLINRKGYDFNTALLKYVKALARYDDDIYKVMMTLQKECPYKGFAVLAGRNPTLVHGAIQLLYATKIKTDVEDETISISSRICKAPKILGTQIVIFVVNLL